MPETVRILDEHHQELRIAPGQVVDYVVITYIAEGGLPRRVMVDAAKDSQEERIRVIAADLKAARERVEPTLEIPDEPPPPR